jgi:hypothetical protein
MYSVDVMKRMFMAIDLDGDGSICENEVRNESCFVCWRMILISCARPQLSLLYRCEANADGINPLLRYS